MAIVGGLLVIGLLSAGVVLGGIQVVRWLSPTHRALGRARRGDVPRALADLTGRAERQPTSARLQGALGQVYLLDRKPAEAEAAFRRAMELGSRKVADQAGLSWALVRQGRLDEALSLAEQAHAAAPEEFGIHCLYCGLMAHHHREAEVAELYDFLKRRSAQLRTSTSGPYRQEAEEQFAFAQTQMQRAGYRSE